MPKAEYKARKTLIMTSLTEHGQMNLVGHTAMHSTLLGSMESVKNFKEKHGIEIMHALVMTDGDDTMKPTYRNSQMDSGSFGWNSNGISAILPDGFTKINFSEVSERSTHQISRNFPSYLNCDKTLILIISTLLQFDLPYFLQRNFCQLTIK